MKRLTTLSAALGVALALALSACTSSMGPQTIDQRLSGTWSEDGLAQVEGEFTMVLAAHDTIVTGTGHYADEALRSGTVTITGVIEGQNIDLTVTFDYGDVAHFNATLQGTDTLGGSWYTTSDPIEVSFSKVGL